MNRIAALAGSIAGALAVAAGAFGAHALRTTLDAGAMQIWHTAVEYQLWHALALLACAPIPPSRWTRASIVAFCVGISLFCGSLYALALGAPRAVGAVTPLGGLTLLSGWCCLGAAFWRTAK